MLSAPISFQKKNKKKLSHRLFHATFELLFSLFSYRREDENRKKLSLSHSSERIILTKKAPRRSRFFSVKEFCCLEGATNERRKRESVRERERVRERESRGIRAREEEEKEETLPFF